MLWAACFYPLPSDLTSGLKGSYGRPRRISTILSEAFPSPKGFEDEVILEYSSKSSNTLFNCVYD